MTELTEYRRGRSVASAMHVHSVFVTKYQRKALDDEMLTACEKTTRKACQDFEAELKDFNGEKDHVHLLITYLPKMSVSGLVNSLKGASARNLRRDFTGRVNRAVMHGHLWSPSYFAASCGGAPLSIVKQYIEQQQRPA